MRVHLRWPTLQGGLLLVLAYAASAGALAQTPIPDEDAALATSQAAIARQLGDYQFVDQHGQAFRLSDLGGKPVVLSLVYTSCYYVCSGLTVHLRDVARVARQALGPDSFTVLTVGFDTPNDTRDVGFTYRPSPKGFDHITQTTVIDRAGRVVLQVYGQDFNPPNLVEPLKRLIRGQEIERGTLAGMVRSVKLFCTIYDPASGRYRFDYSIVADAIAGILALGMVAIAIAVSWRNSH
jgi:protein SCO1